MIISLQQHIDEATKKLFQNYNKYSVAVLTAKNSRVPTFIGSGFCLRYKESDYFVTASHVADSIDGGVYLGKINFRSFNSKGFRTQRESEQYDIAILPMSNELAKEIGIEFITVSQTDRNGLYTEGFHCLIGYPASKNKLGKSVLVNDKQINSNCYAINTHRIEVDYSSFRKSVDSHIAIEYGTAVDAKIGTYNPPSLKGISGAPLWVTKDRFDSSNALLAGFLIEYHKNQNVAFCTKIEHVLGFIDARYA